MFGRDGLEELVKAKPFKRNDLVKKLFPDNTGIFAEALEGDVSDDELRTLEEDLSRMEPKARAEVAQSLASKLTISAESFTRGSVKKMFNFLIRYFQSCLRRRVGDGAGSASEPAAGSPGARGQGDD